MAENKANIGPRIVLEGEAEYKKAILEAGKNTAYYKTELKALSVEFEGNANSLEALRAKNEIYLKQQEEQNKKLQVLRGALDETTKKYGENSVQAKEWQAKLNTAYAELNNLNKEISKNEKYLKEAKASTDQTATSIDRFGKEVKSAGNEAEKAGEKFKINLKSAAVIAGVTALAASIKNVSEELVDLVKNTAAYADDILTMSAQTGIATDTLQELNYMQELTDVSLETTTKSMAKQIKSMYSAQKGTEDYVNAYKKLQVEFTNMDGSLRKSDIVYWEIIDALGQMANETERDATAMLLLGRSAQDLNPLIQIGSAGVAEFAREARNMGAVLSNETLDKLGETDDALQRLYQQLEISKRNIGAAIAPEVTDAFEKIANKIDEVDDKIADFAKDAIEPMVDGFIWIIDHADAITAGIKGITAGIITKKAADGVVYAVEAYKTLKTATEAATVAQTAFNVASKANVIGAIASIAIGAGTALYSYAKSVKEASDETEKLNDETQKLKDAYKEINETIQKDIENRNKSLNSIKDESNAVLELVDSLYDLSDQENKSNISKQQMISLVEQINKTMPEMNLTIDEQTGALSKQREEIEKLVQAHVELSTVNALKDQLPQIALNKYAKEKELNALLEERKVLENDLDVLNEKYRAASELSFFKEQSEKSRLIDLTTELNKKIGNNIVETQKAEKAIEDLGSSYEETLRYIGQHSDLSAATRTLDNFLSKYKETLDSQNKDFENGLSNRIDAIKDTYKESEKALEKSQKAEKKALDKAQKEQTEAIKAASDEELKILEKKHKKKLELINEEYLKKMKLADEDRYNAIKEVQDQIDAIDAQTEAEDRAIASREEAEKRAELILKVEAAKTAEERLDAQKELADFEEKTARDRLKTERGLQKNILEEQKDTINEAYKAKIETLEEEKKQQEENAELSLESEKKAIADRLEKKKEELGEIHDLERESLDERHENAKDIIDKQKAYAIQSAKDTYEEDLRLFKVNNALKYDEAVANQELIKKNISQSVFDSSGGFSAAQREFVKSNLWDRDYIFGNQFRLQQNTSQIAFDYSEMEDRFVSALKNTKLEVILEKDKVGSIVEKTVNKMIQR